MKTVNPEYIALWHHWGIDTPLASAQLPAPAASSADRAMPLAAIVTPAQDCTRCGLCKSRQHVVIGNGGSSSNPHRRLLFIGEAPSADDDLGGKPFIGNAGDLLTKIIEAMGYRRQQVYLTHIVKCRPPEQRNPLPEEAAQCRPFLRSQIEQIKPKCIVALGPYATAQLVAEESAQGPAIAGFASLRGRFHALRWDAAIPVMPTYPPEYLLNNPAAKKQAWEDMKLVKSSLEKRS